MGEAKKPTMLDLHRQHPFDYKELAMLSDVDDFVVYRMAVGEPVSSAEVASVLAVYNWDNGTAYTTGDIEVALLPNVE